MCSFTIITTIVYLLVQSVIISMDLTTLVDDSSVRPLFHKNWNVYFEPSQKTSCSKKRDMYIKMLLSNLECNFYNIRIR